MTSKLKDLFRATCPRRESFWSCISYPQQRVVQVVDNLSGGCKGHRRPVSTERRPGLHGSHESASGRLQVPLEIDLFAIERGSITAPAGCGKTQLIAETLIAHRQSKPILVLTHTNAGVAALRARLRRAGVPNSAYRVSTIDGFSMRLIAKFPARSGHNPQILQPTSPTPTTLQFGTPPCCYCRQATLLSLSVPLTRACLSTNTRTATSSSTPSCQVWPRCYRPACSVTQCKPSSTFVAIDWCIGRMRCSPCSPRQESLRIPWRWRLAGA